MLNGWLVRSIEWNSSWLVDFCWFGWWKATRCGGGFVLLFRALGKVIYTRGHPAQQDKRTGLLKILYGLGLALPTRNSQDLVDLSGFWSNYIRLPCIRKTKLTVSNLVVGTSQFPMAISVRAKRSTCLVNFFVANLFRTGSNKRTVFSYLRSRQSFHCNGQIVKHPFCNTTALESNSAQDVDTCLNSWLVVGVFQWALVQWDFKLHS